MLFGARESPLSQAQAREFSVFWNRFFSYIPITWKFSKTTGDVDRDTSLRNLGKTDFFTKELDQAVTNRDIRAALHAAKDLPDPLPSGLVVGLMTPSIDSRDCLVVSRGGPLPQHLRIATSSQRREEQVAKLFPDQKIEFIDLRGTIEERLALLKNKEVDGVVVAEAALVRLNLSSLPRFFLPGDTVLTQGQLALVVREKDHELRRLLATIQFFPPHRVLYLGLDPAEYRAQHPEKIVMHYPVIRTERCVEGTELLRKVVPYATRLLFTSKSSKRYWPEDISMQGKEVIAIGKSTAAVLPFISYLAAEASQEGVIALLKQLSWVGERLCWPRSRQARSLLEEYLVENKIAADIVDLYDTVSHIPGEAPCLSEIDEIMFTSPSCVEGFIEVYGKGPFDIPFSVQGEATRERLENSLLTTISSLV